MGVDTTEGYGDEGAEHWTRKDDYKPGSMGCHEALHTVSLIESLVDKELLQHPAIRMDPDWRLEAERALLALRRLYQLIGGKHLS